jgi:polyphenol oxidase
VSALRLEGADATAVMAAGMASALPSAPEPLTPSPDWAGSADDWAGSAEVRFSERADGDMADPSGTDQEVAARRRALVDRPWTWLRQAHGARVVVVDQPGGAAGESADAAVSDANGTALAILTADCAPIALASPEGVIGVVHAGWRGLLAGVVAETVAAMRGLGATSLVAALGPCIHPECYSFSGAELDELVARFGVGARSRDRSGAPALDLPFAVRSALAQSGASLVSDAGVCTACSRNHWSWRARAETQRQAMVAWRP